MEGESFDGDEVGTVVWRGGTVGRVVGFWDCGDHGVDNVAIWTCNGGVLALGEKIGGGRHGCVTVDDV